MRWKLTVIVSTLFWAATTYVLVRREIIPYFAYESVPTYRGMIDAADLPEYRRYELVLGQQKVGDVESRLRYLDLRSDVPFYELETRMRIDLGQAVKFAFDPASIYSIMLIDPAYQLHSFKSSGRILGQRISVDGVRHDDRLTFSIEGLGRRTVEEIDFPRDATVAESFLPVQGAKKLSVGQKWKPYILEFDFFAGGFKRTAMYAHVEERETVAWNGTDYEAFRIDIRRGPKDDLPACQAWVLPDGTVIKQAVNIGPYMIWVNLAEKRTLTSEEDTAFSWKVRAP